MPELIALIWAGANVAIGFNDLSWAWCLLLAVFGLPLHYCFPSVTTLLRKGGTLFLADLRRGGMRWLLWVYFTHLPAAFLFYVLGRVAHAVL